MDFIWFIFIGLVAGALAGQLVQGGGFGVLGDIVIGIIGALLGGFLFNTFGISTGGGLIGSLIVATIGAVVLLYGIRLVNRTS
ncbi:Transglycosylase associated protein [Tumidithrix helvetica PCC 7403]|uniref:GlsB/YeaQ/YmgE family stress response membrane protein n=1 Tax=Tumidithrix helvetica TaxID=3457545 RepID=UPI003CAA843B